MSLNIEYVKVIIFTGFRTGYIISKSLLYRYTQKHFFFFNLTINEIEMTILLNYFTLKYVEKENCLFDEFI